MKPPLWESDPHWAAAVAEARRLGGGQIRIIGPRDLAPCLPALTSYEFTLSVWQAGGVEAVLAHKGLLAELPIEVLGELRDGDWRPVFADAVFVLFARGSQGPRAEGAHVEAFHDRLACLEEEEAERRDLAGRIRRGCSLVIWDDSTVRPGDEAHWRSWGRPVAVVNGGRPSVRCALRALLDGPGADWVSVVHAPARARPDFLEELQHFQDPRWRPWLDAAAAAAPAGTHRVDGFAILHSRRCGSTHVHGHRRVWREVLQLPSWAFSTGLAWSCARHGVWKIPGLVQNPPFP